MMEVTSSPTMMDSEVPRGGPLPQQGQVQKKRKFNHEKVVVAVKVEGMKQKYEGPPSDRWSWRKYGQKPIKGSPYPRGYYRCSTSKGCSAKKQVERCRTDPSVLIITYTSNHSHADPVDLLENTMTNNELTETSCHRRLTKASTSTSIPIPSPKQAEEPETKTEERNDNNEDEYFRYYLQSPLCGSKENNVFNEKDMETINDSPQKPPTPPPPPCSLVNENCKCPSSLSADQKSEENLNNDFFDELEELPTSSFFSSFMRRNFLEERILVNPS